MALSETLLPEFDQEMANTRKVLAVVPEDKFGWRPHDRSGTMGWLAGHLSTLPQWGKVIVEQDSIDIGRTPPRTEPPKTRAELLDKFDRNVAETRSAVAGASDERMMQKWRLLRNGQEIFSLPRAAVIRTMVMNHNIHHRAQLGVYLRLTGVAVPGIYGPSADEMNM